ncbi:hypothetical protein [Glycomyces sp. NPDC048151]|uniref:hypothetical protein n=1 Tax=Glycomyces sp. NPDC048151 TaxID=3364002 RepID=UPI00371EC007
MAQQLETAPATSPAQSAAPQTALQRETGPLAATTADVPASPAALWASESRANYSITHTADQVEHAWIDCGCVIHGE